MDNSAKEQVEVDIGKVCVVVASHISSPHRIEYLKECIASLVSQTFPVSIYLSISFENPNIETMFRESVIAAHSQLYIYIRRQKTPQMKHIQWVLPELLKNDESWVLFCDDDDAYRPNRTQTFAQLFANGLHAVSKLEAGATFPGVYESTFGKNHRDQRHEFWCYGIHISILQLFYERIQSYDDVIQHKCCDIVFGDFLRRLGDNYLFVETKEILYDYRVENNSDSITGKIKTNQLRYSDGEPPSIFDTQFSDYVVNWNQALYDNIEYYMHDTFLRTVTGAEFDDILKLEFKNHYALLPYIDEVHVNVLRNQHDYLRKMCSDIYDIGL